MPKVSILIPAHVDTADKIQWLTECLQSVQAQTLTDWEAIIIDDASPLTLGEVKMAVEGDDRFRWLTLAGRSGPSIARNTAAAVARAEALLPLDSDDKLATIDILGDMYRAWEVDPSRIVYGDLVRLFLKGYDWTLGEPVRLGEYTFDAVLDLNGIMPVTAMHSQACHRAAGGWKPVLDSGLEDVEYWVAAGEKGFCGYHINALALEYRRHDDSRTRRLRSQGKSDVPIDDPLVTQNLQRVVKRWRGIGEGELQMLKLIVDLHRDTYEGRYPEMCCGNRGGSSSPQQQNNNGAAPLMQQFGLAQDNALVAQLDTLPDVQPDEKIWVEYRGRRSGNWSILGRETGIHYAIRGQGHRREIHIKDQARFQSSGRGLDFAVGVPAPAEYAPKVTIVEDTTIHQPKPEPAPVVGTLVRPDRVMAEAQGIAPPPVAAPVQTLDMGIAVADPPAVDYDLSKLNLANELAARLDPDGITRALEMEGWSIQQLADARPGALRAYKGIGPKVEETIIKAAKALV